MPESARHLDVWSATEVIDTRLHGLLDVGFSPGNWPVTASASLGTHPVDRRAWTYRRLRSMRYPMVKRPLKPLWF